MRCRTLSFDIRMRVDPGVDLGWTSSTMLSLFYGRTLVGRVTLEDDYTIPDLYNEIDAEFYDIEIHDMTAFRSFIRHVIPQPRRGLQLSDRAPAVALELADNGHKLSMAINLDTMGFAKALEPTIHLTGDEITITFRIHNPTKISIDFREAEFVIRKDGQTTGHTLAHLIGNFDTRNIFTDKCVLKGSIYVETKELFGRAVVKGLNLEEAEYSWRIHALRQFEMEINLDDVIHGDH